MKTTTKAILTVLLLSGIQFTYGQEFYGVGGHLSRISGGPVIKNFGIHVSGEYTIDEKMGLIGSLGFFLPHNTNSVLTLPARNSQASPSRIDVNSKDRTSGFQLSLNGKRYFGNEYEGEGLGFYGLFGMGFNAFSVKSKLEDYDESVYGSFERSHYESAKGSGFTLNFGLGLDFQTESGSFYLEPLLNVPANRSGDEAIDVEIPVTFQINLGYRITL